MEIRRLKINDIPDLSDLIEDNMDMVVENLCSEKKKIVWKRPIPRITWEKIR